MPIICPNPHCKQTVEPVPGHLERCPRCGLIVGGIQFRPLPTAPSVGEIAMPGDAICAFHPTKRAVGVCAGGGDYVCALCAVELDGKTYSAHYLEKGGKQRAQEAFEEYLPRPDRSPFSWVVPFFVPFFVPAAWYNFGRAIRLRRQNPLFRRVVSPGRLVGWAVFLLGATFMLGIFIYKIVTG